MCVSDSVGPPLGSPLTCGSWQHSHNLSFSLATVPVASGVGRQDEPELWSQGLGVSQQVSLGTLDK